MIDTSLFEKDTSERTCENCTHFNDEKYAYHCKLYIKSCAEFGCTAFENNKAKKRAIKFIRLLDEKLCAMTEEERNKFFEEIGLSIEEDDNGHTDNI